MPLLWITTIGVALVTFMFSMISPLLGFSVRYNEGVAFGMVIPEPFQTFLIAAALLIVIRLGLQTHSRLEATGFGSMIGGACANILDRLGDGTVTDMFRIGSFPVFNAADIAITLGVIIVLWVQGREMLFTKH